MSAGLAGIIVLVIVIGISMAASPSGLQEVLPALLSFFNVYLIPFLLGIAFLIFVWNAVKFFIVKGATEEGRENAKSLALYSIAAFVFIFAFWGIINIFTNGLGLDNCNNDIVPDYLGDDARSYAPCTSPRPQPRPN
jgi:Type IV secretion system pilin